MIQATETGYADPQFNPVRTAGFTAAKDDPLRDVLRRCSPPTRAAAREFRRTRSTEHLPAVIHGLIEHYVEPDTRAKLQKGDDSLRLVEDLAIDSLTMLEIVFIAEEVLEITVDNDQLRPFRTVGDIKQFIVAKLGAAPAGPGTLPQAAQP
jgi:3-hydroxyacyl-[acyl-carrier-protein] dehydratase